MCSKEWHTSIQFYSGYYAISIMNVIAFKMTFARFGIVCANIADEQWLIGGYSDRVVRGFVLIQVNNLTLT